MHRKIHITYNAPVTLTFILICGAVTLLGYLTGGRSTASLFAVYGLQLNDPLTYLRLFTHVLGHADLSHFLNNAMYLLILGPMLEEKYGKRLIIVILSTAAVTGIVHNLLSPNTMLLGASGVVFAFIILASITGNEEGIPVTLIIVALLWIGSEIYTGITTADSVSQLTHIVGGLTGGIIGLAFKK